MSNFRKKKLLIGISALIVIVSTVAYLAISYRAPDLSQYDLPRASLMIKENKVSSEHNDVVQDVFTFLKNNELNTDIVTERKNMETLMGRDIPIVIKPADVDGIAGEWVLAEGANPSKRLLYLHGGGFRMGSPKSHRHITYELSKRAGVAVLAVDYRMQPEFKITACHEDARKAYKWILENGPHNASTADSFYIAGDSAGGRI